jgi:hypothetical protein
MSIVGYHKIWEKLSICIYKLAREEILFILFIVILCKSLYFSFILTFLRNLDEG